MIEGREEPRGYRRRGEAFWRRALLAQRESGSTLADFCRRNALSLSTFQRWRRRIEEAVGESAEAPVTDFVELAIRSEGELLDPEVEVRNETTGFELIFPSGVRLRLPEQVDGRSLAEVLWALEATGRIESWVSHLAWYKLGEQVTLMGTTFMISGTGALAATPSTGPEQADRTVDGWLG